jgi:DNA-binding NarL/FixJ family response regulator
VSQAVDAEQGLAEPMIGPRAQAPLLAEPIGPPLARVVLVDTSPGRLRVMRTLLDSSGLVGTISEAATRQGAIEEVARSSADVAVIEIQMPIEEGLATVAALRQHFPLLRIVVCSFHQEQATKSLAVDNGADAYLAKPVDLAGFGELLRVRSH